MKSKRNNSFHPLQIAFCGHSNAGKTTLISRLIQRMKKDHVIGYMKHDAHRFEMDKEGKDTNTIWQSGASQVMISDAGHTACIHQGQPRFHEQKAAFLDCDFIFLEGYKNSSCEKIMMIDKHKEILPQIEKGLFENVIAYIGQEDHMDLDKPYFRRDCIVEINAFIVSHLREKMQKTPLYGLVLAGGLSQRMNHDKAMINYFGKTQAEHSLELLQPFCKQSYLSCREHQWTDSTINNLPQIHDRFKGFGPMGGILSAMETHPGAAWLVIACDLPYLNAKAIAAIMDHRDPYKFASCFRSIDNDLPEPLCAIYEPKAKIRLYEFMANGNYCPRKVLINSSINLMEPPSKKVMANINHHHEYTQLKQDIENGIVQ